MKWTTTGTGMETINFEEAKKRLGTRPKNKFAMELEIVARDIRIGHFDPDSLFIAFRASHPENATLVQYPIASIDMDGKMVLAITKYLMQQMRRKK